MYCWQCQTKLRVKRGRCRRCGAEVSPLLLGTRPARAWGRRFGLAALGGAFVFGLLILALFHFRFPNTRTVSVPDVIGLTTRSGQGGAHRAGLARATKASHFRSRPLLQPRARPAACGGPGRGAGPVRDVAGLMCRRVRFPPTITTRRNEPTPRVEAPAAAPSGRQPRSLSLFRRARGRGLALLGGLAEARVGRPLRGNRRVAAQHPSARNRPAADPPRRRERPRG